MGVAIEGSKISFLQNASLLSDSTPVSENRENPLSSAFIAKGEKGDLKLET
jgi:hypothetical protein